MPYGPPGPHHQPPPGAKPPKQVPVEAANTEQPKAQTEQQPAARQATRAAADAPAGQAQKGPTPPLESKPSVAAARAPAAPQAPQSFASAAKTAPPANKGGRIVPAVPLSSPNARASTVANGPVQGGKAPPGRTQPSHTAANAALQNATQAATAAVAAAMAKLPPAPGQQRQPGQHGGDGVDNLTRKVNEMRTNDQRAGRQQGAGAGRRGGRGRGGDGQQQTRRVEVPKTDYDFESANAKFNKQDLVKEVVATGSPVEASSGASETAADGAKEDVVIPGAPATYNKTTSFFDNISSETKDRNEANGQRPGGREWRGEEVKRNLETFGQGSVDNGYRGGFRGRGARQGPGRTGPRRRRVAARWTGGVPRGAADWRVVR